jgi:ribonuclease D
MRFRTLCDTTLPVTRPHEIIDTPAALLHAIQLWRTQPALAVDTESNSFFVYRERTCLVQVSTRDADWIVDPLAVDLKPLGELLENTAIEKVFHAAEYDILSLKRDYGFVFHNLYDTLIAAKAVGRKKVGLGSLLEEVLATKLAKDEQRSDWGRRPLTPDQIEYAFSDTRYLLALADALRLEVSAKGPDIIEEVAIDCQRMTEKEPKPREVNPDAFEKHKTIKAMDPVSRQILKHLFEARELRAQETNKPPFRVISDEALGEIAVRKPVDRAALAKIPGVTPPVLSRHGDALWAAVQSGLAAGPLSFRKKAYTPVNPAEEELYEALRSWRKAVAEARGVEVDVICGNASLRVLAQARPTTLEALGATALDTFRVRRYGEAILHVIQRGTGGTQAPRAATR